MIDHIFVKYRRFFSAVVVSSDKLRDMTEVNCSLNQNILVIFSQI